MEHQYAPRVLLSVALLGYTCAAGSADGTDAAAHDDMSSSKAIVAVPDAVQAQARSGEAASRRANVSPSLDAPIKAAEASQTPREAPSKSPERPASAGGASLPPLAFSKNWMDPKEAARDIDAWGPSLAQVRVASQHDFIPSRGPFSLLVFQPFAERDVVDIKGEKTERLTYRALIVQASPGIEGASGQLAAGPLRQVILPAGIWSERATRGTSSAPGTDFRKDEEPDGKTLLHLDANFDYGSFSGWIPWQQARVYLIGSAGADGSIPRVIGSFETVIANKNWAIAISLIACLLVYLAAAWATYLVHQAQRCYKTAPAALAPPPKAGALDIFKETFTNAQAKQDEGHGPLMGTNYATFWAHLNPVVLSAASNGTGSATNLQILFFSLVVFGVVSYIWLLTGQLTGLSSTVLLLMGISGLGATAAAGADLAKNRLSFDNWAWLINRSWLPPGGVAEVSIAKWKDIFTTAGAFDVYRFQMICFSVVVGIALIGAGTQLNDLSTFDVPQALLGILGLSQIVYVAGKLVAPPSISDLDAQITTLQAAEKTLRDSVSLSAAGFSRANVVSWGTDDPLRNAKIAYSDYLEAWRKTSTMFETTLGRQIPKVALSKRPPFAIPDAVLDQLPKGAAGVDYMTVICLVGAPKPGPYRWTLESGTYPAHTGVKTAANDFDAELTIPASNATIGVYRFTLRAEGPTPDQTRTKEFQLNIE